VIFIETESLHGYKHDEISNNLTYVHYADVSAGSMVTEAKGQDSTKL